jgi:3-oxoacyl-[acyl-carrier-protein] synthase III
VHGVRIAGIGRFAPAGILTNADLECLVDTTDEWIVQRTGMKRRHIASPDQATSDLAYPAALAALDSAGKAAGDIDLIIVATATPDYLFPATACIVGSRLGIAGKPAFDLSIACSGFVYSCATGASLVRSGLYSTVLVIGAETLSKIVDYTDRSTCVLFGDGAGAVVLERSERNDFLGSSLGADGTDPTILYQPGGGSRTPFAATNGEFHDKRLGVIHMQGQSVFKVAVNQMAASSLAALAQAGLTPSDVDFIVPHQANSRIIDATVKMLKIDPEKCIVNIAEYGNTSSASIPLALAGAVEAGRVKPGNIVVLVAFGGGLSWGATVWRWSGARIGKVPAEFVRAETAAAIGSR